jgi:hypothetical protein
VPGIARAVEEVDVSTPATVIRVGFRPLPNTLRGLSHFLMAGQWVLPGGGLPSGLLTARSAIQAACRWDGVDFRV